MRFMRINNGTKGILPAGLLSALLAGCNLTGSSEGLALRAMAFTPNGKVLVVGGLHGQSTTKPTLQVWDPSHLNTPPRMLPEQAVVYALAVSPDGQTVATIDDTKQVRLWNTAAPQAAPVVLVGNPPSMTTLRFSPDGTQLVAGGRTAGIHVSENFLYFWDVGHPQSAPRRVAGLAGDINDVAFSPDGHWLAAAMSDHKVRVWNTAQIDAPPLVLVAAKGNTDYLAFSGDNHTLAVNDRESPDLKGSSRDKVLLWDVQQPTAAPGIVDTPDCHIRALAVHPSKQTLALGCFEGTTELWDLPQSTAPPVVLHSGQQSIWSVAFSPDGH